VLVFNFSIIILPLRGYIAKSLPDLATQNRLVAQIEKEQALVNANKELIKIYEQKIKDAIAKVWGEERN